MVKLFFKTFISFIKQEKALTILIIIGMLVCNVSILFFTNAYFSDIEKANAKEKEQNQVSFTISKNNTNIEKINNLLNHSEITNWRYLLSVSTDDLPMDIIAYGNNTYLDKKYFLAGENISADENEKFICSEKFNQTFYTKYGMLLTVGYELELNGVLLKCNGIYASNEFDILVLPNTLNDLSTKDITLTYYFKNDASQISIENINSNIIDSLHPTNIIRNERIYKYSFKDFLESISNIIIFLIIAVLNYMFIYAYIINSRNKTYGILKISGVTTFHIALFSLFELFIWHSISIVLSAAIFSPFILQYCNIKTIFTRIGFTWSTMAAINLILYLTVSLPEIIKQPMVLYKEV